MITILLIEDDEAMHMAVRAVVPDWMVLTAINGVDGLELLRKHGEAINLIVLDVLMPYLDGYDTCLRIREIAPELPILPFTGVVDTSALQFLDELHCAPPLLKPVEPALLKTALRATVNTTPPPLAASAVRARAQVTAAEREQAGRSARQRRVLVVAQHWRNRVSLKQIVAAAGLRVSLDTEHQAALGTYLMTVAGISGSHQEFLVATTASDAPALATFAHERDLPLFVVAFRLGEALRLVEQVQTAGEDWPRVGIVVDHPSNQSLLLAQAADVMQRLQRASPTLPPLLTAPFAKTPLSPKEQAALVLALQGYTSTDIGARTLASGSSIRTLFTRMREKLGLESDEAALLHWAEAWWFEQLQQSMTGHDGLLRERTVE